MIDSTLTATRVQGGWALFNCDGQQVGVRLDWQSFPRNYTRYAMHTYVDLTPERYDPQRKAKQR